MLQQLRAAHEALASAKESSYRRRHEDMRRRLAAMAPIQLPKKNVAAKVGFAAHITSDLIPLNDGAIS